MHEYSIVRDLMDRVEAEVAACGATAVHRIQLRIGELSGVETDLLRSAYEVFRERSVCGSAELDISHAAASWVCSQCGETVETGGPLQCRLCSGPARLATGDEIVLERIEMEVA